MVMESAQDQFPVGLRVLVVDDDPTCLFILERMLQRCFYNVTTCGQATIALAMLRQNKHRFDLVISDVHMPDMDGFKLLELIGLEMNIPVIMMSVDGEFSVVLKGVIHGACDYLLKPVRIEALRNIWQHVIRKKQLKSREVEHVDMEDIDRLKHGSENLEFTNSKKRKDIKDNDLDTEDQSTLKKQRVVWSIQLHEQFVNAVKQLGIDKAVPKRILEMMNVQGLTRENVASHLQKYRLYLKRLSYEQNHALNLHYAELKGHSSGPPFWVGPGEFLMPARCNELSPKTFTTAHSGFANGLSFPNNSGLVRVDPPPGYLQISAVEEAHVSPSHLFSNAPARTMEGEIPNPNRSEPTQIMPTISAAGQAPNSSLNDLITDFSQQLNQQHQRYSLQPATERFDVPNRYSMTLAESMFNRLNPSYSGVSKDSLCQHVNPLGPVFGGHLTETAFEGLSMPIIPNGKENFEYPSEPSTKTMGISKFEDNNFTDVKRSFDLLNPTSSLSPSLLRTLHSGLQNRMDAQNSELATKLRTDLSVNTKKYAAQNIKVDWETQSPSLWQGADRRTSGPFACPTQVSSGNNLASRTVHNLEIDHGLDGLGSDLSKKDDGILVQHGKVQGDFEHSTAHANMKLKDGHQVFTSGIREKKESGNKLLAPFLSDDLLSILLKEDNCLQHQKPVFSEHEISIEGFSKGSLYVN